MWRIAVSRIICLVSLLAINACVAWGGPFSGRTGDRLDPFQIAQPRQLLAIGADPNLCDKHYILTSNIDLSGHVLTSEVITKFSGCLDGRGHAIHHLNTTGMGLIGRIEAEGRVRNLSIVDANVASIRHGGILAAVNEGTVDLCSSSGVIAGTNHVGGLVGHNAGTVTCSSRSAEVSGYYCIGGLIGQNVGSVRHCSSTGKERGGGWTGGFVGNADFSYRSSIEYCYSTATVIREYIPDDHKSSEFGDEVGGFAGTYNWRKPVGCFWDTEASGHKSRTADQENQVMGLTTEEMTAVNTYLKANWDFADERANGMHEVWIMPKQGGYPVINNSPGGLVGQGTVESPYLLTTAADLGRIIHHDKDSCYRLTNDIDLSGIKWASSLCESFQGQLDGNGFAIQHFCTHGTGLIRELGERAYVFNLEITDANVISSTGGILAESNWGTVAHCSSSGVVSGYAAVGGLLGINAFRGTVICCSSQAEVSGEYGVGGLVGYNEGTIRFSLSTGSVRGCGGVGGFVGHTWALSLVEHCYSTAAVRQEGSPEGHLGFPYGDEAGGFAGGNSWDNSMIQCFWDVETSGQENRVDDKEMQCLGLSTGELTQQSTYLKAGWDFVNERANGLHDVWRMSAQGGYPTLDDPPKSLAGRGTIGSPYLISSAHDLGSVIHHNPNSSYKLANDIDVSGIKWPGSLFNKFKGRLNGNGYAIHHFASKGRGLVESLGSGAIVHDLGVMDANVMSHLDGVGILAGESEGILTRCFAVGIIRGPNSVGGLLGVNKGEVRHCYSDIDVSGIDFVGGLVGEGSGGVHRSYSSGQVAGHQRVGGLMGYCWHGELAECFSLATVTGDKLSKVVGGLVGENRGQIRHCYSRGSVYGNYNVGGLVGQMADGEISLCYSSGQARHKDNPVGLVGDVLNGEVVKCFWRRETNRRVDNEEIGYGASDAELKDLVFLSLNGWAHESNWTVDQGKDYPRLAWQGEQGVPIPGPITDWIAGEGLLSDPFQIADTEQLRELARCRYFRDKQIVLANDIDITELAFRQSVIPEFEGCIDGRGFTIRSLRLKGGEEARGFIGSLASEGRIVDLAITDAHVDGWSDIGVLVGVNHGEIRDCLCQGHISGGDQVGGLVGTNHGSIDGCRYEGMVDAQQYVGGLVGKNNGAIMMCTSIVDPSVA